MQQTNCLEHNVVFYVVVVALFIFLFCFSVFVFGELILSNTCCAGNSAEYMQGNAFVLASKVPQLLRTFNDVSKWK